MSSKTENKLNLLKDKPKFSLFMLAFFITLFVVAGVYFIYRMYAASTFDLMTDETITVSTTKNVERLDANSDYTQTAINYSKKLYPTGGVGNLVIATDVASEMNQGVLLASALKSPFLLTSTGSTSANTLNEITRIKPTKIYIVGTTSLTSTTERAIANAAPLATIIRISGTNRNELAKNMGQFMMKLNDPNNTNPNGILADGTVVVVNSTNLTSYYATYAAGLKKYPLLYVDTVVPAETKAFLSTYRPTKSIIIGNTNIISDTFKASFPGAIRIGGANRYELSYNILGYANNTLRAISYSEVGVVPGSNNYVLMLATPYMAYYGKGILVDSVETQSFVIDRLNNLGKNYGLSKIKAFGSDLYLSSYNLLKYANTIGSNYTAAQLDAQKRLDTRIRLCPILKGALVDFGDARGSQAVAYYYSGRIVISPTHTASIDGILNHEIYHILDYREGDTNPDVAYNNDPLLDYGERIPWAGAPDCTP